MSYPVPEDYKNKKILAHPYDQNNNAIPSLIVSITDPDTGAIVGYLPLKATDNGDGTATLKVDTELNTDSVTVNDVKVGSSDGQVSGDKWLKVEADGTVIVKIDDLNGLATADKQDESKAVLDNILLQFDVALSTVATEATLATASITLSDIKDQLTTLLAIDFATETTLQAVKTTLDSINETSAILSGTFTATGMGSPITLVRALSRFSIVVKGTGAAADVWTVAIEGSLDGTNYSPILTHTATIGDGEIFTTGASAFPSLYLRINVSALTLGAASNIAVFVAATI